MGVQKSKKIKKLFFLKKYISKLNKNKNFKKYNNFNNVKSEFIFL